MKVIEAQSWLLLVWCAQCVFEFNEVVLLVESVKMWSKLKTFLATLIPVYADMPELLEASQCIAAWSKQPGIWALFFF